MTRTLYGNLHTESNCDAHSSILLLVVQLWVISDGRNISPLSCICERAGDLGGWNGM